MLLATLLDAIGLPFREVPLLTLIQSDNVLYHPGSCNGDTTPMQYFMYNFIHTHIEINITLFFMVVNYRVNWMSSLQCHFLC